MKTLSPPSAHSQPHLPSFAWSNLQFQLRCPNHTPGMKILYEEREGSISGLRFFVPMPMQRETREKSHNNSQQPIGCQGGCYKLKWFNGLSSFFSGVSRGFDTFVIPIKELCCTGFNATLVLTEKTKVEVLSSASVINAMIRTNN
eukprot:scaffold12136_cov44-Cyclotella_meneghiniana.AAC.1